MYVCIYMYVCMYVAHLTIVPAAPADIGNVPMAVTPVVVEGTATVVPRVACTSAADIPPAYASAAMPSIGPG